MSVNSAIGGLYRRIPLTVKAGVATFCLNNIVAEWAAVMNREGPQTLREIEKRKHRYLYDMGTIGMFTAIPLSIVTAKIPVKRRLVGVAWGSAFTMLRTVLEEEECVCV